MLKNPFDRFKLLLEHGAQASDDYYSSPAGGGDTTYSAPAASAPAASAPASSAPSASETGGDSYTPSVAPPAPVVTGSDDWWAIALSDGVDAAIAAVAPAAPTTGGDAYIPPPVYVAPIATPPAAPSALYPGTPMSHGVDFYTPLVPTPAPPWASPPSAPVLPGVGYDRSSFSMMAVSTAASQPGRKPGTPMSHGVDFYSPPRSVYKTPVTPAPIPRSVGIISRSEKVIPESISVVATPPSSFKIFEPISKISTSSSGPQMAISPFLNPYPVGSDPWYVVQQAINDPTGRSSPGGPDYIARKNPYKLHTAAYASWKNTMAKVENKYAGYGAVGASGKSIPQSEETAAENIATIYNRDTGQYEANPAYKGYAYTSLGLDPSTQGIPTGISGSAVRAFEAQQRKKAGAPTPTTTQSTYRDPYGKLRYAATGASIIDPTDIVAPPTRKYEPRGAAYEMAERAEKSGTVLEYGVTQKAAAQGYQFTEASALGMLPTDKEGKFMSGRNMGFYTSPTAGGRMVTDPVSGRTTFVPDPNRMVLLPDEDIYYPAEDSTQVKIPKTQTWLDTVTGEVVSTVKTPGGGQDIIIAGAGIGGAQSGTISTKPMSTVIRNWGYQHVPEGDVRGINLEESVSGWEKVLATPPEEKSHVGAPLYGGIGGIPLIPGRVLDSTPGRVLDTAKEVAKREAYAEANVGGILPSWFPDKIPTAGVRGGVVQFTSYYPKETGSLANLMTPEGMRYEKGVTDVTEQNVELVDRGYTISIRNKVLSGRHVGYVTTEPTMLMVRPEPVGRDTNPFWATTEDTVKIGGVRKIENPLFIEGESDPKEIARTILIREPSTTIKGGEKYFPAITNDPKYGLAYGSTVSQQTEAQKKAGREKDVLYNINVKERVADKTRGLESYTEHWEDIQPWEMIVNPDPYAGRVKPNVGGRSGEDLPPREITRLMDMTPTQFDKLVSAATPPGKGLQIPGTPTKPVGLLDPYTTPLFQDAATTPAATIPGFGLGVAGATRLYGDVKGFVAPTAVVSPVVGSTNKTIDTTGTTIGATGGNVTITKMRDAINKQTIVLEQELVEIEEMEKGNVTDGQWTGTQEGYDAHTKRIADFGTEHDKYKQDIAVYNKMDAQNPSMISTPGVGITDAERTGVDKSDAGRDYLGEARSTFAETPLGAYFVGTGAKKDSLVFGKWARPGAVENIRSTLLGFIPGAAPSGAPITPTPQSAPSLPIVATGAVATATGLRIIGTPGVATATVALASSPVGLGIIGGAAVVYGAERTGALGLPEWIPGGTGKGFVRTAGSEFAGWLDSRKTQDTRVSQEKSASYIGPELPTKQRITNEITPSKPVSEFQPKEITPPSELPTRHRERDTPELPSYLPTDTPELPGYIPTDPFETPDKHKEKHSYYDETPMENPLDAPFRSPVGFPVGDAFPTKDPLLPEDSHKTPFGDPFVDPVVDPFDTPQGTQFVEPANIEFTDPFTTTFPNPDLPGEPAPRVKFDPEIILPGWPFGSLPVGASKTGGPKARGTRQFVDRFNIGYGISQLAFVDGRSGRKSQPMASRIGASRIVASRRTAQPRTSQPRTSQLKTSQYRITSPSKPAVPQRTTQSRTSQIPERDRATSVFDRLSTRKPSTTSSKKKDTKRGISFKRW